MSAFEIITEEEFKASAPAEGRVSVAAGVLPSQTATGAEDTIADSTLTYCKFCNDSFIAEYHFGEKGGDNQ